MGVALALKVVVATELQLFGDEAFYWWESQYPAAAYSDLPFLTSALVSLGTSILGDTFLGVRLFFLVLGGLLPLGVFILAEPIVGKRDAYWAALASLIVPMVGTLGLLAIPDVPLVVLCTYLIAVFERALRTGMLRYWFVGGVLNAVGFCIHYRFAAFFAAAGIFLLVCQQGRKQWRKPGLYLALLLTLPGLYPLLSFNLQNEFGGLLFHFSDRHAWEFHPEGLGFWWQQAVLVTPLLFLLLACGVFRAVANARDGDWQSGLIATFSMVYILGFGLLNPWADQRSTTLHWPLPGYVFALVLLPATLRAFWKRWLTSGRRALLVLSIASAKFATLGLIAYASITAWGPYVPASLSQFGTSKMAGWTELFNFTQGLKEAEGISNSLTVTVDYHDAAQIAFARGNDRGIYTTDTERAVRDGRALQLSLWQRDEKALRQMYSGQPALIVLRNEHASGVLFPSTSLSL